jgi:predicted dienelactone hydrolase
MLDVTDPTRPTPPRGAVPGHPGRDLPSLVLSPAALDGGPLPGPWPLVVFAHGFATTPFDYLPLLRAWASDGYAVAAPYLPGERSDVPGAPDEDDRMQEPADLSAVISGVLAASATPGSTFAGLIDPSRIAVAGHSDGAMAVAALTLNSADHDPRIRAALILSGAELGVSGGVYGDTANVPVLIAQGTADPINNPAAAIGLFAAARSPKALLWILNAGHLPPYVTAGVQQDIVRAATADFLDASLWPSRAALARLAHDGDARGLTSLVAEL